MPWSGDLAFTKRLLEIFGPDELRAILSHELGHLRERPLYRWGRLLGSIQYALMGLLPCFITSFGLPGLVGGFVGYILLGKFQLRLSRQAELAADRTALDEEPEAGGYAHALERLHEDNLAPAVMGGSQTHPDLWDRMVQAGVTPDYPRPAPPAKGFALLCAGVSIISAVLLNHLSSG